MEEKRRKEGLRRESGRREGAKAESRKQKAEGRTEDRPQPKHTDSKENIPFAPSRLPLSRLNPFAPTHPVGCVVVANGAFPTAPLPLEMLQKASVIIACDGAVEALLAHGLIPDAIVGDFDSIPENLLAQFKNGSSPLGGGWAGALCIDKDQETNDLTKAVHYACDKGEKEVLIVGATGLREDHTLGNISLLSDYGKLLERVDMVTDYGIFTPFYETTTFESRKGQQISILSLTPDVKVTTENLRWPLNERPLTSWWQGTLNEALGDSFTIHLSSEGRFIMYRLF